MYSPFTITVKHQDGTLLTTIDVSDSHELQDKIVELRKTYPDGLIEYSGKVFGDRK